MSTRFPKKTFIALLILILLARAVYIEFRYVFVRSVYSYSPEESKDKGIFIKALTPSKKEVYYNRNYNLIIKEAWLEHLYYYENKVLWLAVREDNKYRTLNIIYAFRDKRNGQITKKAEEFHGIRLYIDDGYMGELPGLNLLFTHLDNKQNLQFKVKSINDDGDENQGTEIIFR